MTIILSYSRLLAHWTSPPEGMFKLNVDGSFLEDSLCLGTGGVIRNHEGEWIAGFSHYEVGGDALLVELRAIQIGIDICHNRSYTNVICESDCLEVVKIFIGSSSHNLHVHASTILQIFEALQQEDNYILVHILLEQNMCADFMAKEGTHSITIVTWDRPPPGMESLLLRGKLGT